VLPKPWWKLRIYFLRKACILPRALPDFGVAFERSRRLPDWLKKNLAAGQSAARTEALVKEFGLHTICESGRCPNRDECYSQGTATFMIMGDVCTRSCSFCSVSTGKPGSLEEDEPHRVAQAVRVLGLRHVVVTSVNRDDLADEGVRHFVKVMEAVRGVSPDIVLEILTPDFRKTQPQAVEVLLKAGPDIFNHNVETVPRLYRTVRPQGDYERSLQLLRQIGRRPNRVIPKSGLMVGLGERQEEVLEVMRDLREAGCQILTLGQYLQSSGTGLLVKEYVRPQVFAEYKEEALQLGFPWVESAPFVRSSFHAKESFESLQDFLSLMKRG
jgi:lipoic acid synthetase